MSEQTNPVVSANSVLIVLKDPARVDLTRPGSLVAVKNLFYANNKGRMYWHDLAFLNITSENRGSFNLQRANSRFYEVPIINANSGEEADLIFRSKIHEFKRILFRTPETFPLAGLVEVHSDEPNKPRDIPAGIHTYCPLSVIDPHLLEDQRQYLNRLLAKYPSNEFTNE